MNLPVLQVVANIHRTLSIYRITLCQINLKTKMLRGLRCRYLIQMSKFTSSLGLLHLRAQLMTLLISRKANIMILQPIGRNSQMRIPHQSLSLLKDERYFCRILNCHPPLWIRVKSHQLRMHLMVSICG
jgi:hypothetical protein